MESWRNNGEKSYTHGSDFLAENISYNLYSETRVSEYKHSGLWKLLQNGSTRCNTYISNCSLIMLGVLAFTVHFAFIRRLQKYEH